MASTPAAYPGDPELFSAILLRIRIHEQHGNGRSKEQRTREQEPLFPLLESLYS
jgi:hypothetical protein